MCRWLVVLRMQCKQAAPISSIHSFIHPSIHSYHWQARAWCAQQCCLGTNNNNNSSTRVPPLDLWAAAKGVVSAAPGSLRGVARDSLGFGRRGHVDLGAAAKGIVGTARTTGRPGRHSSSHGVRNASPTVQILLVVVLAIIDASRVKDKLDGGKLIPDDATGGLAVGNR
mmetsp:Transcript_1872/g.4936  ORF Transcript_1872/g.4936 Transcript_1872/m.4936 type:complete len:169 (+) Transcript_1872:134-640(+)